MFDNTNRFFITIIVLVALYFIFFKSENERFVNNRNTNEIGGGHNHERLDETRRRDDYNYVDPYYDSMYGITYDPYDYSYWYPSPFWSDPLDYSTIEIDVPAERKKKRDTCKQQCFQKYEDVTDNDEYIKSVGDCVTNCKRL